MNGRTLLQARFVSALAFGAAVFAASMPAFAQGGESSPAQGATSPSATEPAKPEAKPEAVKPESAKPGEATKPSSDDPKKKAGQAAEGGGGGGAAAAMEAAPPGGGGPGASVSLGGDQPKKDEVKLNTSKTDADENRDPFAGSIFFWDHSLSTQTARLETSAQQSYVPLYEWWFSFQPRYHFNKKLQATGRFDYTKELTNSQDSTYYREGLFGDGWLTLRYDTPVSETLKNTKVSVLGTLKLPFSKESQANGVYFKAQAGVGIGQKIKLNGESAKWLQSVSIRASAAYEHAFSRATTPTGAGFTTYRQDTDGRTLVTDQITGGMLAAHTGLGILAGDLSITEKWSANLSLIMIDRWNYAPTGDVQIRTETGTVGVPRSGDSTLFSQTSWIIFGTEYEVIDEMSLGLGYYNLAGIIAPDGERRGLVGDHNIWWSPSARVFATVTANLDKIYERAAGIKPAKETAQQQPGKSPTMQGSSLKF